MQYNRLSATEKDYTPVIITEKKNVCSTLPAVLPFPLGCGELVEVETVAYDWEFKDRNIDAYTGRNHLMDEMDYLRGRWYHQGQSVEDFYREREKEEFELPEYGDTLEGRPKKGDYNG